MRYFLFCIWCLVLGDIALACEAPYTCVAINKKCDYKVEKLTWVKYEAWKDAQPDGAMHEILWTSGEYVIINYPVSCVQEIECREHMSNKDCTVASP